MTIILSLIHGNGQGFLFIPKTIGIWNRKQVENEENIKKKNKIK